MRTLVIAVLVTITISRVAVSSTSSQDIETRARQTLATLDREATIEDVCARLTSDPQFVLPSMQFIVLDDTGRIWFLTNGNYRLWTLFDEREALTDAPILAKIKASGDAGIWFDFFWWENDLVRGYFKRFTKNKQVFYLGIIHFDESEEYQRAELLFRMHMFNREHGIEKTIQALNSPSGPFVYGTSGISLYTEEGLCIADSYDQTRVNLNIKNTKDDDGNLIFAKIQAAAPQERESYGWTSYKENGLTKRVIVHRVHRTGGRGNFLATSSYFPDLTLAFVEPLVDEISAFIAKEGTDAFTVLNSPKNRFIKGNLAIVVYAPDGTLVVHSEYPSLVGVDALKHVGQRGKLTVPDVIRTIMREGSAWLYHYILNAAIMIYGKKVITKDGTFIVTVSGFMPDTRQHAAEIRNDLICQFLEINAPAYALRTLNQNASTSLNFGPISYGNLNSMVFNAEGFCIAAGPHRHQLWTPLSSTLRKAVESMKQNKQIRLWTNFIERSIRYDVAITVCTKGAHKYILVSGYMTGVSAKGVE